MKNKEEGNLLSFRIFFNKKGLLMSEYSTLPIKEVPKFFKELEEQKIIEKVITEGLKHLADMHEKIELELNALNTRIDA
jgi:DNA mismatch repair ATPase MutS